MGGLLGLVGLGRVMGSQKTTPLEDLSFFSGFSDLAKMELCDIPVLGAREISDAAEGVAVWKTGFPMTGLEGPAAAAAALLASGFRGRVDDLGIWVVLAAAAARLEGKVLVFVVEGLGEC